MADRQIQFERLKLLYDYTKFHIGLYSIIAGGLGLFASHIATLTGCGKGFAWTSAICIVIAGVSAGVIASSIPEASDIDDFLKSKIGPLDWRMMPAKAWTRLEHVFFWLSILFAALTLISSVRYDVSTAKMPAIGNSNVISFSSNVFNVNIH